MIKAISSVALAGLLAFPLSGCNNEGRADMEPYLHRVSTVEVAIDPGYRVEREFAGEVQAGQSSQLGFESAGQVAQVFVDVGDTVETGQALARLDSSLLETERVELDAQRAELQAELETAERNLARVQRLQAENLASERELDDLTGRTRVLRASLQRIAATAEANKVRREKSVLKAPFPATVSERWVDSGVVVSPGMPVLALVQDAVREIHFGVPAELSQEMARGQSVSARAGSTQSDGVVIGQGPVVDQATRSRIVRVSVEQEWAPGTLAYVTLGVPVERPGAWLPDTAITAGARGTWVVYAAIDEGDGEATLEARSVVVQHASRNKLFVTGALTAGDRIIAGGLHRLAPGQRVRTDGEPGFVQVD